MLIFCPGAVWGGNGITFFWKQRSLSAQLSLPACASEATDACPGGPIAAGFGEEVASPSHPHSLDREAVNTPFSVKLCHISPRSLKNRSSSTPFANEEGTCISAITLSPLLSSPTTHLPLPQSQFSEVSDGCVPEHSYYAPILQWGHNRHVKDRTLHIAPSWSSVLVPSTHLLYLKSKKKKKKGGGNLYQLNIPSFKKFGTDKDEPAAPT